MNISFSHYLNDRDYEVEMDYGDDGYALTGVTRILGCGRVQVFEHDDVERWQAALTKEQWDRLLRAAEEEYYKAAHRAIAEASSKLFDFSKRNED